MPQDPEFFNGKKRVNIPQFTKKVEVLSCRVSIITMKMPKNGNKGERHKAFLE